MNSLEEFEVVNYDLTIHINVSEEETVDEVKDTIMNLFDYKNKKSFELYIDEFHLNEFYNNYKFKFFLDRFIIKKFNVIKKSDTQPYEFKKPDFMETLLNINNELSLQSECENGFLQSLEEMTKLENSLLFYLVQLDDKLKLNEEFRSTSSGRNRSYISEHIDYYEKIINSKELVLEVKMHQLFSCKKKEKTAIEIGKKNRDLVNDLDLLEKTSNLLKIKINNVKEKEIAIRKKKQSEANLMNNYIISKRKVASLESIKLRFSKLYKNEILLKYVGDRTVLVFHRHKNFEEYRDGKLEVRKIIDETFLNDLYSNNTKRDEIFLNFKETLFISIQNLIFLYYNKTNSIYELPSMNEDHKGGCFIYVPGNNYIYSISGLVTPTVERLCLDNFNICLEKKQFDKLGQWNYKKSLKTARSYFSVCVINAFTIYVLLGFNLLRGEFISTIERYDTSEEDGWEPIKIVSDKLIKLTFAGVLVTSDEECFILGGKDEHNNDNYSIFVFDLSQGIIEDSDMKLPAPPGMNIYHIENKNLYYQESNFLPIQISNDSNDINNMFYLCCFDNKNFVHRINIKTFDYSYIHQELDMINESAKSILLSQISHSQNPEIELNNDKIIK